jgi:hypothetical protein
MSDQDYEMGQMSARLDVNDERHEANIAHLEKIDKTLKELVDAIALARGGIRMLFAVGTVAAAIGAFTHNLLSWVVGHFK